MTLPDGYVFRKLKLSDYSSYVENLKVLTTVGNITIENFTKLLNYWESLPDLYHPYVISSPAGVVVATGMLLVEHKLIHECGLVGHIEDISVSTSEQGKKLGYYMITSLTSIAKEYGCYKVILDCSPENAGFYGKCGFKQCGIEMSTRFD
ncbi:glucosamine 6-phosphate N-acetyltransferase [Scheffersomyces coipomensis]|uniref:glucosamine 6-phosphate N-acetyltransferase n=1 Tax=Scheffersomyces coipomensis TaxID=1788519 RepID=UPI00315D5EC8